MHGHCGGDVDLLAANHYDPGNWLATTSTFWHILEPVRHDSFVVFHEAH
jgi:hypothetical protein